MTVSGAYGRDYKSLKQAKLDWADGKDFIMRELFSRTYINKQDWEASGKEPIMLRYQRDTKIGRLA